MLSIEIEMVYWEHRFYCRFTPRTGPVLFINIKNGINSGSAGTAWSIGAVTSRVWLTRESFYSSGFHSYTGTYRSV